MLGHEEEGWKEQDQERYCFWRAYDRDQDQYAQHIRNAPELFAE